VVLGLRDGALVGAEVAAATKAEVRDPRVAEAMEEVVAGAGVITVVVAVADHARATAGRAAIRPDPQLCYFRSGG
jgi:hypothetical protein